MNIAIVGTGYIAGRHAEVLSKKDDVTISAHVDVSLEGATIAAKKWGGRPYDSIDEMLSREKIEAVWICIPPFAHGDVEAKFINQGIPMYIEKPVAADIETAALIEQQLYSSQSLVNVGYYWRVMPVVEQLRQLLKETPARFVRAAWHGVTPPARWWQDQAKSGGQVVEQATHLVDLMRYLLGEAEVVNATASFYERLAFEGMNVSTTTTATLQFSQGVLGILTTTCVLDNTTDASIEFYCDGRKISLNREALAVQTSDGVTSYPITEDPLKLADDKFVDAINNSDVASLTCSYAEAFKTQKLCVDIQQQANKYRGN